MTEEQIAALKQENADLKAERASLKKALDEREADNKTARDKAKTLQTELDTARAAVPPEGAQVLTPDEAKALAAYVELGTPDVLAVKLGDYDRAASEASALKRDNLIDQAARDQSDGKAYRYEPDVLKRLLADATLTKSDKGYTVTTGEVEKPLEKWVEEDMSKFAASLTVQSGTPVTKQPGPRTNPVTPTTEDLAKRKAARGDYYA